MTTGERPFARAQISHISPERSDNQTNRLCSLSSPASLLLHHQRTTVSSQLLLWNDMDARGRRDPRPISKMSGPDWGESLYTDPAATRRPTEKKGSWTPSVRPSVRPLRSRPPVVSAFDHINVVGLHNLKPTKGPSGLGDRDREGGVALALHWRRVRREKKERQTERGWAKGANAAFEASMENPTGLKKTDSRC